MNSNLRQVRYPKNYPLKNEKNETKAESEAAKTEELKNQIEVPKVQNNSQLRQIRKTPINNSNIENTTPKAQIDTPKATKEVAKPDITPKLPQKATQEIPKPQITPKSSEKTISKTESAKPQVPNNKYCKPCDKNFATPKDRKRHEQSKKHLEILEKIGKMDSPVTKAADEVNR